MHAADIVETLPTARLDDDVLSAVRMVAQRGLPGLVVADEQGKVVTCLSSVDLLRLMLPRYLLDEPLLARVFDEEHADRIASALVDTSVRDVVGDAVAKIPVARSQATVVELAETMARQGCPLIMVEKNEPGTFGIVTADHLLAVLVAVVEGKSR